MENEKRAARNQQEDAVLNRVLIWFGGAVAVEFIMLLLSRFYINFTTDGIMLAAALAKVIFAAVFVGAAGFVLCAVWLWMAHKNGKKTTAPAVLTLVFAVLFVTMAITHWLNAAGIQFLCGAVPVVAVLALVYYLYQREFFVVTLLSAMGILGLWMLRRADGGHRLLVYGYMIAALVVLVAAVLVARVLQKSNGLWRRGEKKLRVFPHGVNYATLYLTGAVVAAALLVAALLGTAAAYYLIFGLVAWLFVMAVYYTVKLM